MGKLDLNQADFLFHSDALSGCRAARVSASTGEEELSRTFRFEIDLVSSSADVDLDAPIGQPAYLLLRGRLPTAVATTGMYTVLSNALCRPAAGIRQSRYQATLVPTAQQLAYSRDSRIFQKQKTEDVVQKVLKDGKVPSDWVNLMLHGSYEPRDYCVQYQESDLEFVQRLLEEEGITYYFEQKKDKDVLCIGDGNHAFDALPEYAEVQLRDTPAPV
jgi:type VI secretion system secreted protein VgrG